jgi:GNAT superfamily N-acetyltransferase
MPIGEPELRFREATTNDAEFIYRVVETTMRSYVERTWGAFSEEHNRKNIAETIAAKNYSIIEFNGEDIGAISVERHSSHIQLTQLFIVPSHQNRGIGTSIVRHLAHEARQTGRPLRLRVLSVNPARRLYEREGFRITSTTPERVYMELYAQGNG